MRAIAGYLQTFAGLGRNARLFLITTIIFGAATSLYWIDFNLYLDAIGLDRTTIGWLMATSQLAGVIVALPASMLSDRYGRRAVMAGGMGLVAAALLLVLPGNVALIFVGVALLGAGSQAVYVVQVPYIAEHTEPEQRNSYFALWAAIGNITALVAALAGGAIATSLASSFDLGAAAAPYQILIAGVAALGVLSAASVFLLSSDRPAPDRVHPEGRGRFGIHISNRKLFFRLLLPGFLTSLGAGQLIPFLNLFIKGKFGLDLAEINAVFGITMIGTTLAILAQPAIARRFGRIGSIVLVQGSSIPFLLVLGFSPVLWTVVVAMTVRNSLMNAGSPIFDAFAMEHVSAAERATLSAGMTMLWALGWTVAPIYYGTLQDRLGFTAGYTVDFITIIVLYTIATSLLWYWFRGTDRVAADGTPITVPAAERSLNPIPAEPPTLLEHA
jgi:MFS family permease